MDKPHPTVDGILTHCRIKFAPHLSYFHQNCLLGPPQSRYSWLGCNSQSFGHLEEQVRKRFPSPASHSDRATVLEQEGLKIPVYIVIHCKMYRSVVKLHLQKQKSKIQTACTNELDSPYKSCWVVPSVVKSGLLACYQLVYIKLHYKPLRMYGDKYSGVMIRHDQQITFVNRSFSLFGDFCDFFLPCLHEFLNIGPGILKCFIVVIQKCWCVFFFLPTFVV